MSDGILSSSADRRFAELQALTARIQHEVNNPLAALLAETQLLAMEPTLPDEHRETVERVVALVRRVVASVRKLDQVREGPPA
ncbi:MAG: hypothetical protein M3068_03835 [Gemmatimonadota bacterium]|nr:hypothetical protein [Gemmatimonadota bacterium]